MDEKRKKSLRMSASMEGQEIIVANIGRKLKVSEMELICLANFAEIGLMSVFSALDGKTGEDAEKSLNQHLDRIRKTFCKNDQDGLNRLSASAAAMLRGKFFRYIA